eukprot:7476596-Lingulodinium_polyedra.AAC.1
MFRQQYAAATVAGAEDPEYRRNVRYRQVRGDLFVAVGGRGPEVLASVVQSLIKGRHWHVFDHQAVVAPQIAEVMASAFSGPSCG